jgi:hypothetical protein
MSRGAAAAALSRTCARGAFPVFAAHDALPVSEIAECRLKRRIELLSPAEQRVQLCVGKAFTAKIPLGSREASSFLQQRGQFLCKNCIECRGRSHRSGRDTRRSQYHRKSGTFFVPPQPFELLLTHAQRDPSRGRHCVTAASHCRVDNVGLVATGPPAVLWADMLNAAARLPAGPLKRRQQQRAMSPRAIASSATRNDHKPGP